MSNAAATIRIVAAVILDDRAGRWWCASRVRAASSSPVASPNPARRPALARELDEELGVQLRADAAIALGTFEDWAVNEPGHRVQAQAWWVQVDGAPQARAEIAELAWVPLQPPHGLPLAPLSEHHILPVSPPGRRPAEQAGADCKDIGCQCRSRRSLAAFPGLSRLGASGRTGFVLAVTAADDLLRAAGTGAVAAAEPHAVAPGGKRSAATAAAQPGLAAGAPGGRVNGPRAVVPGLDRVQLGPAA